MCVCFVGVGALYEPGVGMHTSDEFRMVPTQECATECVLIPLTRRRLSKDNDDSNCINRAGRDTADEYECKEKVKHQVNKLVNVSYFPRGKKTILT